MKEKKVLSILPVQRMGKAIKVQSSIELTGMQEAKTFFNLVRERLRHVNDWHEIAGSLSARFQLVDNAGAAVNDNRGVIEGDYLRIDIPGPGSKAGDGYDWVCVEQVESASTAEGQHFGFLVRPTANPEGSSEDIAHFYSHASTSTFAVTREGTKVTVAIYDRNTTPNRESHVVMDKMRDAIVGAVGVLAFSKIQWKNLADGIVRMTQEKFYHANDV